VSSVLVPRRSESRAYWPASLGLMLVFFFYACFNVTFPTRSLRAIRAGSHAARFYTRAGSGVLFGAVNASCGLFIFSLAH